MKQIIHTAVFLCLLVLMAPEATAQTKSAPAETPSASTVVRDFYARLTETMKQGEALGFDGRFNKLKPAVETAFDLPLMARVSAGAAWQKASFEERVRLTDSFAKFSIANYASRFVKYDGETFDVLDEKPASGGGFIVETRLTPKGEEPVILNYLVRKDAKGTLRIVDVYLDASISELATRRSEFSAIINRDGWDALIASLEEKTKKMGG